MNELIYRRELYNPKSLKQGDIILVWTSEGKYRGVVRYATNAELYGRFWIVGEYRFPNSRIIDSFPAEKIWEIQIVAKKGGERNENTSSAE